MAVKLLKATFVESALQKGITEVHRQQRNGYMYLEALKIIEKSWTGNFAGINAWTCWNDRASFAWWGQTYIHYTARILLLVSVIHLAWKTKTLIPDSGCSHLFVINFSKSLQCMKASRQSLNFAASQGENSANSWKASSSYWLVRYFLVSDWSTAGG